MPHTFFSFPLNVILALMWAGGVVWLWRSRRDSRLVRFFLSSDATLSAIGVFIFFSLIIGLTGIREVVTTWVFIISMLYFQTVLLFVIIRGWRVRNEADPRHGKIRWRFLLNHFGILLTVASAFWGAPDSETLRVRAEHGQAVREAYTMDGRKEWLDCEIVLEDFKVETYSNGVPSMYEARMSFDEENVILKVNHPHSLAFGKDVYLTGYDVKAGSETSYCIIQIVYEPWKYGAAAGIILMLAGALLLFVSGPERKREEER